MNNPNNNNNKSSSQALVTKKTSSQQQVIRKWSTTSWIEGVKVSSTCSPVGLPWEVAEFAFEHIHVDSDATTWGRMQRTNFAFACLTNEVQQDVRITPEFACNQANTWRLSHNMGEEGFGNVFFFDLVFSLCLPSLVFRNEEQTYDYHGRPCMKSPPTVHYHGKAYVLASQFVELERDLSWKSRQMLRRSLHQVALE